MTATLAGLYHRGHWRLPPARSDNLVSVQAHLTSISFTDQEDYFEWEIDGHVSTKYGTGAVYKQMRGELVVVP